MIRTDPPAIPGVRRSFVEARGVRFHVTEAGDPAGRPVVCLHGWPQHHYLWRDLLGDPPEGLRIIAPDLPGYGWSGRPPHRWAKQDVADDVVALLDALGLDRVVLVGHDWGGWVGHLVVLGNPDRIDAYLALNIPHQWNGPRQVLPQLWRQVQYQPLIATFGMPLHRRTRFIDLVLLLGVHDRAKMPPELRRIFADRFRDPVRARVATDTYRTFLLREAPHSARHPETRHTPVPIRTLFGVEDKAMGKGLFDPANALADDYRLELVPDCGHFIVDERPDLVRARLLELTGRP